MALQLAEQSQVDGDTGGLHVGQRLLNGQLHFPQQRGGLDAGQLVVQRIGQVGDGAGPQDRGLDGLLVGSVDVVEQRKLLLFSGFRAQLAP